jgi:hypothetical protein
MIMYGKLAGVAGPVGALAFTGLTVAWLLVAAFTLLFAGIAVLKLVPRGQR